MAPIKNFNKQNPVLLSEIGQKKQPGEQKNVPSSDSGPKDIYAPSVSNPVAQDMSLLERHRRKKALTKKRVQSATLSEGGPGTFWDARANSKEMHRIADQQVDKNGAFSPQAVLARGAAVFYDYSIAGAAQECGETFGDPTSTTAEKAWSTTQVGLHLLDATPLPGSKIVKGVGNVGSGTLSVSELNYK